MHITVADIPIEIVRKDIKNMHLAVYPPAGRVRLAAPHRVGDDALRQFAISRLSWIKKQQRRFREQDRETEREYVSGETHYFKGQRYQLTVQYITSGKHRLVLDGQRMTLYVREGTTPARRGQVFDALYRDYLKEETTRLMAIWQPRIGVTARDVRIQRMRTKWGSCNPDTGRILLNLELAKKPVLCLEYIIVHELIHLIERTHNDHFMAILNQHIPDWVHRREVLNRLPVKREDWGY